MRDRDARTLVAIKNEDKHRRRTVGQKMKIKEEKSPSVSCVTSVGSSWTAIHWTSVVL